MGASLFSLFHASPYAMDEWIRHAQNPGVLAGGGGLLLLVGYLVWRICRTVVRIGFFAMFTLVGFGIAAGASLALNGRLAPLPVLYSAAIGFGFFVSAIRSKVMKAVGAVTVLLVAQAMASMWIKQREPLKAALSGKAPVPKPPPK